jgi:hypothetical protein
MAMPRVSTRERDIAMARLADEPELLEALGLVPYWGHETTGPTGRGKVRIVLREPEFYDEAEERERERLKGSSHANLTPLPTGTPVQSFNGYNSMLTRRIS